MGHAFAPKSEHSEGDRSYQVVNKGPETAEAFARDRLGDLFDRLPIMVLNDEAHHCYRPKPAPEALVGEEAARVAADIEEATIWVEGLDRINNARADRLAIPNQIGYPEGANAECPRDIPRASPTTCDVAAVPRNWQPPPGESQALQPNSAAC